MYYEKITNITQGCDFTLRIRAKRVATRGYVNVSFVEVSSIHFNLVSLPATKTALAHTIDEDGRLLLYIPGQTLDCNTYGIEILGFYNNGNWRQQIAPAFNIVRTSTEDNYALTESDERTIDLVIIIGETYHTTKGFNQAMEEYDVDNKAHQKIRNQLSTMETKRQNDVQNLQTQMATMKTNVQDNVDDIAHLQTAGKVDDAIINGTSALNGKVANINMPDKVSDLDNDSNYQNT